MASITIRNLDESTKQALRERAARNGNSMEEEARLLLGEIEAEGKTRTISAFKENVNLTSDQQLIVSASGLHDTQALKDKRILLVIGGGIAAYKCLDLIRRLRERGASVRPVMTKAAEEFVTPLSLSAICNDKVFSELFDRDDEHDIGHIRLSREADLIVVAPATADLMAKMANGHANDLASTVLMATDKPVLIAPAMNPMMWHHPATQRNLKTLTADGIQFVGPASGEMAESGEAGLGRMAEPMEILGAISRLLDRNSGPKPLDGKRAIVTSGPTHEPIDPVRYIANRSSGKQGHAIAAELAKAGAEVILISGPVKIPDPRNVETFHVQTAREMLSAVEAGLPADIAVMVAAVADWRTIETSEQKMKKKEGKGPSSLELTENPDILKTLGAHKKRPELLIGFAAETEKLEENANAKLTRKNADWIVANDVSPEGGVMGGEENTVKLVRKNRIDPWPKMDKTKVAERLVHEIIEHFVVETVEV